MKTSTPRILFLPGAGASASFWRPAADRLDAGRPKHFFSWPGLGNEPSDPNVRSVDDLVAMVLAQLHEPADLVAQSMGGYVAARVALTAPHKVRRLVLTGTSAGIPISDLGGIDWRANYRQNFPRAASWITEVREDLSSQLKSLNTPTLLLWGAIDQISPPTVGERLLALLPNAALHIVPDGDHDFPNVKAAEIAPFIAQHLG